MSWRVIETGDGPDGTWRELELRPPVHATAEQVAATLAFYEVHLPRATMHYAVPMWSHYIVAAIHLRPSEFDSEPPHKQFPSATHEVMALALDPVSGSNPGTWQVLDPPNVVCQVTCTSDEVIRTVVRMLVEALVKGTVPIEDGGAALSRLWQETITNTIEHVVTGGHPD